jgi:small-conductance mechanosensitive channel
MFTPKFKIGDKVRTSKSDLYGQTVGIVVNVQRMYKEVNRFSGRMERGGLTTDESTIKSISLPYTFDGETLTVDFPESDFGTFIQKAFTMVSKFYGYSVTVETKTPKSCTGQALTSWSEKSISKL